MAPQGTRFSKTDAAKDQRPRHGACQQYTLDTELLYLRLELLNGELAVRVRSVRDINLCLASAEPTLCCRGLRAVGTVGGALLRASDAKD